ncbi:MAG: copper oxidase [Acidocella sp. 21-58-7]|nr:MAG: copper oxidase [Acidocella sp. 21-58-7]HQT65529.1 multicopper oxidase family protein [Acidocella sp.]
MRLSRRNVLAGTAGLGLLGYMPWAQAQANKLLTATSRILEVNGKPAKVFGLMGPDGKPGLMLSPGERFAVTLDNQCGTDTIVHWHGQLPDWKQDGFPWPQTPAIANGVEKSYNFAPIPGTFWMHSHQGMQEQQLMAAPLIVHDTASAAADVQEVVMMMHDFSFKNPDELLAGLTSKGGMMSGGMGGMNMSSGGMMGGGDLNDIDYDAYLTNERTLADPQIIRVTTGQNIRLRIINGASSTNFWIDLGAISGQLIAVDGHDVKPVTGSQFPIAMAQRLDILLKLPSAGAYPVFAQVEGKTARTGLVLATANASISKHDDTAMVTANAVDLSLEASLSAAKPLSVRDADITIPLRLGGDMSQYVWSLNGSTWPNPDVLMIKTGQRVVIDMTNRSMMSHPMHLHGHAFQVVAINGQAFNGAIRDTVLVPSMGGVRIAFDANNQGRWALHCHNLYHMMSGMMTEVRYAGVV